MTSLGAGQNLFQILEILVTEMYVTSLGAGQNQLDLRYFAQVFKVYQGVKVYEGV